MVYLYHFSTYTDVLHSQIFTFYCDIVCYWMIEYDEYTSIVNVMHCCCSICMYELLTDIFKYLQYLLAHQQMYKCLPSAPQALDWHGSLHDLRIRMELSRPTISPSLKWWQGVWCTSGRVGWTLFSLSTFFTHTTPTSVAYQQKPLGLDQQQLSLLLLTKKVYQRFLLIHIAESIISSYVMGPVSTLLHMSSQHKYLSQLNSQWCMTLTYKYTRHHMWYSISRQTSLLLQATAWVEGYSISKSA